MGPGVFALQFFVERVRFWLRIHRSLGSVRVSRETLRCCRKAQAIRRLIYSKGDRSNLRLGTIEHRGKNYVQLHNKEERNFMTYRWANREKKRMARLRGKDGRHPQRKHKAVGLPQANSPHGQTQLLLLAGIFYLWFAEGWWCIVTTGLKDVSDEWPIGGVGGGAWKKEHHFPPTITPIFLSKLLGCVS